ncbi:MAG: hypothetical protein ABSA53_21640 [Streptosporangiaceae bacterium]
MAGDILSARQRRGLEALDRKWGDSYDLLVRDGRYLARRGDDSRDEDRAGLEADTPAGLIEAMRADQLREVTP